MNNLIHYLTKVRRTHQQGMSMIEVLVALVIIALALLGTAGMQAKAIRLNQGGQFRSQAILLASDLSERMEANKVAAVAGLYALSTTSTAPTLSTACTSAACNSSALATYDLSQWQNAIAATLPQSSWGITATGTNPITYTITIGWVDRRSDTVYQTAGTGEAFSYVATRTILN